MRRLSTITKPIFTLEKGAIKIINSANYQESTNQLWINLQTLTFNDVVNNTTAPIMNKVNNNIVAEEVQNMFQIRTYRYGPGEICVCSTNECKKKDC